MGLNYDFSGWATRNDLKCTDGRTIRRDAFKEMDGETVPLVWNHNRSAAENVLGHAVLENRDSGVYAYCTFNKNREAQNAKELVEHGDITALSIWANQLQQRGGDVLHGTIREVSLVLAGANPGAFIDSVIVHGEESEEEAVIYTGEPIELYHADDKNTEETPPDKAPGETAADIYNTLSEKQKNVVAYMIGEALENAKRANGEHTAEESKEETDMKHNEGDEEMKHNVFDAANNEQEENTLSHAEVETIFADAKRYGSLKDSVLAHGITNIDYLFPDAQTLESAPGFIKRDDDWVSKFMGKVHHTPFSRIKSMFANITEEDARAKGYIKGKLKKEEVFGLLKRTTTPTTIYKKQKLDRDDVVDITDFDVVAWLKTEMRTMLNEEIARAALVGDGRSTSSDDKINETNIRPIWTDDDLYTIKALITGAAADTPDQKVKAFIRTALKARKSYKGSGNPVLFTTEDLLTDALLLEDTTGRVIYESVDKLKTTLRISDIVTVPVMEGLKRTDTDDGSKEKHLMGIIVNPADYNIGADKGGAINMFDDFDIDYNAQRYLMETRCSGALVVPYSAIAIEYYAV